MRSRRRTIRITFLPAYRLECSYLHSRRGRNGLAALAKEVMLQDPFSQALFVFIGRKFDTLKILGWDRYANRVIMGMAFKNSCFLAVGGLSRAKSIRIITGLPGSSRGEKSVAGPCARGLVFEDAAKTCASFEGPPRYTRGS